MAGRIGRIRFQLRRLLPGLFLLFFLQLAPGAPQATEEESDQVQFKANITSVDANLGKDTRRLQGDVVFEHGGAKMYCDSAYFYSDRNALDAFSNVYINQGDTVHLYGDFLNYDGNTKLAKVREHVKLINKETTLTTDALDYDIAEGIGYYMHHANIVNVENHLESEIGHYYTRDKLFDFQKNVVVINPDYTIYSDRMKYNTETKITYFNGPTEIIGDSNYIYCEKGWYNTQTDISELEQNALVQNTTQTIKGDYLYYEKLTGYGMARKNVQIIDDEQSIVLTGEEAEYQELIDYAMITDSARFIQIAEEDSLFMHADTLLTDLDTAGAKQVRAFYGVRIYRSNLQGRCDSMVYSTSDSVIRMYHEPVLWSEQHQIKAKYIEIHTEHRQAKTMYLYNAALIISMEDTLKFNQVSGKNMVCHFRNNEIYRIDVSGNGQSVYYPKDSDGVIGANKAICSDMVIFMKEGGVESINMLKDPDATLYPLEKAPEEEMKLKGFAWLEALRPMSKDEIFTK